MKITILGSGSKGNSTYVETKETKILIDAGLSYLETRNRLLIKKIELKKLDAIFITHEHTDHIGGLARIALLTDAKIYIHESSYYNMPEKIRLKIDPRKVRFIEDLNKYQINDLTIIPLKMSHDTTNCFGFLLKDKKGSYAHMTDTGIIKKDYFGILKKIDTILIESNHDLTLLENSNRPYYLIKRIASDKGHLSNVKCAMYLNEIVTNKTKRIILAHLSEECNEPSLAIDEVKKVFLEKLPFELLVANQYIPLDTIEIGEEDV